MNARDYSCSEYSSLSVGYPVSRRSLLATASFGLLSWLACPKSALAQLTLSPTGESKNILIVIFLEGGLDGIHAVIPYGDASYRKHRPTLAMPEPGQGGVTQLDNTFGLHPALGAIQPLYDARELAIVHAVGSGDQTRSHFEARGTMERGAFQMAQGDQSGWIARYLQQSALASDTPLRAVSLTTTLPDAFTGNTSGIVLPDLNAYRLQVPDTERALIQSQLERLYGNAKDAVSLAGQDTLQVIRKLEKLDPNAYRTSGNATYPDSPFGQGLRQAAMLVKAEVGLEVAYLNAGGWDTHVAQGGATGNMANLMTDFGSALSALHSDLGESMKNVTVVAMTEFGRRAYENTGLGTDHGRASVFFALGAGVNGGKVFGDWPGLHPDQLEEPGDLRVTTDYRTLLSELIQKRTRLANASGVFEGFQAQGPLGVFR